MRRCTECAADIEGTWTRCPLCDATVVGESARSPFPAVPLTFSRRRVLRILFLSSLAVIVASFAAQLLLGRGPAEFGALRSVWLGVSAMWLVALTAIRKRHNVAKNTVYIVVLVGVVCVYWDYLTGWYGWSMNYAVPIVCASSVVALLITVRVLRMEVGEHIVYSGLTILLGLVPIGSLIFGWVTNPVPSAICGGISVVALVLLQIARGAEVRHELAKRLHL
ncbi:DUF6320 domain-containing protein [Yaniella flava]|uniref:DUF6320 domain-containing protein n=1 Tax=Yaniella flava TaxID=287930 RepID=A0ABP5FGI7_9MICC|nr:hypothetical protein [Micrococcaceae bacterium]